MISSIADYQVLGPLGDDPDERLFLAVPPPRLGLAADRVAIKIQPGLMTPTQVQRATRELRIFAAVRSPFLVELYDAGQEGDRLFYAMEHPSLGTLAVPARVLTADEQLRAVAHAARGAHALHEAGIAHRNITPSRVLLHEEGAKLADLGMAKFIAAGLTLTQTPAVADIEYLDPAVLQGSTASRASDIWSLGVTLHWVMSGSQPMHPGLPGQQPLAAVRQVLNEPPMIASTVAPAVAAVIGAALSPDPAERPATAAELADRIDELRGGPVSGGPVPDGSAGRGREAS